MHGFNSSPDSHKAKLTAEHFSKYFADVRLFIPKLPPEPERAIQLVCSLIAEKGEADLLGIIGSSLGGYYSIYLKSILNPTTKIILINPAMRPFELLQEYIGENTNYYTGEVYEVCPEHMSQLQNLLVTDLNIINSFDQDSCLLLTQIGDEVLDYSQATYMLVKAKMWVFAGGDHSFQNYNLVLPEIINFLKM